MSRTRHVISEEISLDYSQHGLIERVIHEYVTPDEGEHYPYRKIITQFVDFETQEVVKEEYCYEYEPSPEVHSHVFGNSHMGMFRSPKQTFPQKDGKIKLGSNDFITKDEMTL